MFSVVIRGDLIPSWFKNQSAKLSLRQAPPDCSSCSSKWIGYALCVLVGAEGNPGALGEDHANTILCSWKPGLFIPASFRFKLRQVIHSDHVCVFLLPSKHYPEHSNSRDPKFIEFLFQGGPGLKAKKCGVRALYKQEVEEDLRMRQNEESTFDRFGTRDVVEPAFSRVISGNGIPGWFKIKRSCIRDLRLTLKRDSVRLDRPCFSCCNGWMGFAFCVLFGSCSEVSLSGKGLRSQAPVIWCSWKANRFPLSRHSCVVSSSDHLCVFFIPVDKFLHLPKRIGFQFKSNKSLKVKRCAVRPVYKNDFPRKLAYQSLQEELLWSIKNCGSSRGNPSDKGSRISIKRSSPSHEVLNFVQA